MFARKVETTMCKPPWKSGASAPWGDPSAPWKSGASAPWGRPFRTVEERRFSAA